MKVSEMVEASEEEWEEEEEEEVDNSLEARHMTALEILEECGVLLDFISDLELGKPFTLLLKNRISAVADGIYDFIKEDAVAEDEVGDEVGEEGQLSRDF